MYRLVVPVLVAAPVVVTVVTVVRETAGVVEVAPGVTIAMPVKGTMAWILDDTEDWLPLGSRVAAVKAIVLIGLTMWYTLPTG